MKFQVIGPDGIPTRPEPFDTREEAEAEKASFPDRYRAQGYYSAVGRRIPLDELPDHLVIEEVTES